MTTTPGPASASPTLRFVTFLVGDAVYGVPITEVREIRQWSPVTALPDQPVHTLGLLNLRGTIIPVQDLRVRFGAPAPDPQPGNVIVIAWIAERPVGVLVDAVSDILSIPEAEVQAVPAGPDRAAAGVTRLVTADTTMIALLDLSAIFQAEPA